MQDFERKIQLDTLMRRSDNDLVKKTASIISKDHSDNIVQSMRDDWKHLNTKSKSGKERP